MVTDAQIEAATEGIKARLSWASLHWGVEDVHPDAWPHIARAALTAAAQEQPAENEAGRAYREGRWCGECRFGAVEDPPCCTQPAPRTVSAEEVWTAAREACGGWVEVNRLANIAPTFLAALGITVEPTP